MNFQTAGIVGGIAFLLSLISGLLGGVPFFDVVLRALFWAALGFGASLGIEMLLRAMVPELFTAPELAESPPTSEGGRSVDIVLDEDAHPRSSVIEEGDPDAPEPEIRRAHPVTEAADSAPEDSVVAALAGATGAGPVTPASDVGSGEDEEMPEIGSFLDAFKPGAPEEGEEGGESAAPSAPEYGDYAPRGDTPSSAAKEVTIDGEAQDPQILAKAVQTVMKRDGQGS